MKLGYSSCVDTLHCIQCWYFVGIKSKPNKTHRISSPEIQTIMNISGPISAIKLSFIGHDYKTNAHLFKHSTQMQSNLIEEKRRRAIKDQQLLDLTHRTDLLTTVRFLIYPCLLSCPSLANESVQNPKICRLQLIFLFVILSKSSQ